MNFLTESATRIKGDLIKEKKVIDKYTHINKIAAYCLGCSSIIVYLIIWRDMSLLLDNVFAQLCLYIVIGSIAVITIFNNYQKNPKEKVEYLRKTLIKKIEWDFCKECKKGCVHKDDFIKKMEKDHGINLYY